MPASDNYPKLKLPDQSGAAKAFTDLTGAKGLVVFVYAKDNTSGCTTEASEFQALAAEFAKLGFGLAGVSKDSVKSHQSFAQKQGLGYPLLSDPELVLIKALGAWGTKKLYGKEVEGTIRTTAVFDAKGQSLATYPKVKAQGHAARVLADLSRS